MQATTYLVTLDDKHYKQSVIIKASYDENGFDNSGIHKDTNTEFDIEGYNVSGLDFYGKIRPITYDIAPLAIVVATVNAGSLYRSGFGTNWNTYYTTSIHTNSLLSAIEITSSSSYSYDGKKYQMRRTGELTYKTCEIK
jgi:ABC-type polysaccharide transport system permease subunit